MFLGNLSSMNEHAARKRKGAKKKTNVDDLEKTSDFPYLRRLQPGMKPIVYSSDTTGSIPREVTIEFLRTMTEMMLDERNLNEMIDESVKTHMGLHDAAVKFQRDVMEYNFQVERNFGCRYLAKIPDYHPTDTELIEAAKTFMFTALKSYLKAIKQRSSRYKDGSLTPPNPNDPMKKITILEFLEACNALMALPETKEELRSVFLATKEIPGQRIIEFQRSLLPLLGYDADFGVRCLNKITSDYPDDVDLYHKFQIYAAAAEFAGLESSFTDVQRKAFYMQVPAMMYHFPHMFFIQQRILQGKQKQMAVRAENAAADRIEKGVDGGCMDVETLKASGILSVLASHEGRQKLRDISVKMHEAKIRLETEVSGWDFLKRKDFSENFKSSDLFSMLGQSLDPAAKINALFSIQHEEIDKLMTLVLVMAQSDSNVLINSLQERVELQGTPSNDASDTDLRNLVKTVGSLVSMADVGHLQSKHFCHEGDHRHSRDVAPGNMASSEYSKMRTTQNPLDVRCAMTAQMDR